MAGTPRVLLDVGPLGLGYANPRMQTGIYRVTERTLALLPHSGPDRLGLTATASWILDRAGEAQLAAANHDLAPCWIPAHHRPALGGAQWTALIARARRGARLSPARVLAALGVRGAAWLHKPKAITGEWDVLHSFFDPLPDSDRVRSRAQALTIYDLSILSHPGFHLSGTIAIVRHALASLLHAKRGWAVCISEFTRNDLVARTGFPPERAVVIPLGVDRAFVPAVDALRSAARDRYGIGPRPYLLCVSSMEPRKNLVGALRGFARFCELQPTADLQLVLAGPAGWLNSPIGEEIRRAHVPVRHLGFVPDRDLPALYSGARGFLYPSHAEGFGLPVLEAMACGTPVLTSNTSSLPEVAGDAAVLVDPGDVGAIADGIGRLLQDGAGLSARGRERASRYTWAAYRDGLSALHERMARA